jgi:3-oxoacyl-[acyl-carrier-protein] synthase-3
MYVPPGIVTNDMLSRIMDTSDEWILPRTGIRERRYVDPAQGSSTLGVLAARAALENAGLTAKDIDFVIFATMTPDHYFPGNGGLLAHALGMETTHALDIRMQCAGFLSGLQTADAFIRSGTYDRILLVGADVHSSLMPWPESVCLFAGQ